MRSCRLPDVCSLQLRLHRSALSTPLVASKRVLTQQTVFSDVFCHTFKCINSFTLSRGAQTVVIFLLGVQWSRVSQLSKKKLS